MLMGMLYRTIIVFVRLCRYSLSVLHIGVGFGVARFTELGNAKASMRGTSDRYRFPRFFILNTFRGCGGESGTAKDKSYEKVFRKFGNAAEHIGSQCVCAEQYACNVESRW